MLNSPKKYNKSNESSCLSLTNSTVDIMLYLPIWKPTRREALISALHINKMQLVSGLLIILNQNMWPGVGAVWLLHQPETPQHETLWLWKRSNLNQTTRFHKLQIPQEPNNAYELLSVLLKYSTTSNSFMRKKWWVYLLKV